jgi:hypothetical protein
MAYLRAGTYSIQGFLSRQNAFKTGMDPYNVCIQEHYLPTYSAYSRKLYVEKKESGWTTGLILKKYSDKYR